MLLKICFSKILLTAHRFLDMVTLGNKTAGPFWSKHMFCRGQLSMAAAPPLGYPPVVSRRRRSQDSGGMG